MPVKPKNPIPPTADEVLKPAPTSVVYIDRFGVLVDANGFPVEDDEPEAEEPELKKAA